MSKKVVLAGGTGFIGTYFSNKFKALGYEVLIISRQKQHISWNNQSEIVSALNNSNLVINLAGKSVDCRYTSKNKTAILNSRIQTTKALGAAIHLCDNPPELWINSSTATIYRHSEDKAMTESDGEIGNGFSVVIAKKWEESFFSFALPRTRQVALRIAIVLGKNGGVMTPFKNLVHFGLGGKQGNGLQMFSWIHIEDLFNIVLFLQKSRNLSGIFNCSSPHPVNNKTLMKTLRKAMRVPFSLPSPKWLLTIGTAIIRTETELILKSRWVIPERLINEGFSFKFPSLESTLKAILTREK
ncbi:TIGR01777 family protein [bacterium]|jgi:uncharacterized protein|nr:TIGR01777 family protein [bacterium]